MGRGQDAARCGRDGGTIGTREGWRLRSRSDRVCWFRWGWLCGSCGGLWSTRLADIQVGNLRLGGDLDYHRTCADRKSTRLNSSHVKISYAVFCLKKKKNNNSTKR